MLILHYTGMVSAAAALDRLCDPAARVSAHYVIEEQGAVRKPRQRIVKGVVMEPLLGELALGEVLHLERELGRSRLRIDHA